MTRLSRQSIDRIWQAVKPPLIYVTPVFLIALTAVTLPPVEAAKIAVGIAIATTFGYFIDAAVRSPLNLCEKVALVPFFSIVTVFLSLMFGFASPWVAAIAYVVFCNSVKKSDIKPIAIAAITALTIPCIFLLYRFSIRTLSDGTIAENTVAIAMNVVIFALPGSRIIASISRGGTGSSGSRGGSFGGYAGSGDGGGSADGGGDGGGSFGGGGSGGGGAGGDF